MEGLSRGRGPRVLSLAIPYEIYGRRDPDLELGSQSSRRNPPIASTKTMSEFSDHGYPSDCTGDCSFREAPLGYSSRQYRSAQCGVTIKKFLGVATSTISQADADLKAIALAQCQADLWYRTTACYAQDNPPPVEIVIGAQNL